MLSFWQIIVLATLIYIFIYKETDRICTCLEQRQLLENFNEYLKEKGYVNTDDVLKGGDFDGDTK